MEVCVISKLCLFVAVCMVTCRQVYAGRAFPVKAEQSTEKIFKQANPNIVKDPTNFLVDLSGRYSVCSDDRQRGGIKVDKVTPDGISIAGLVDYYKGAASDVNSVERYLGAFMPLWIRNVDFVDQIRGAEKFGCSVQPGCSGYIAVACLFSPGEEIGPIKDEPNPKARAFTPDQYSLSEAVFGVSWDREHYIENLSAYDIGCDMVSLKEKSFRKSQDKAKKHGFIIKPVFGSTPNEGDTEEGIKKIIRSWKKTSGKQVGCSLIPDCFPPARNGQMYIVVTCFFTQ